MDSWLWPSVRIGLAGVMLCAVIPLAARVPERVGTIDIKYQAHPDEPSDVIICRATVVLVVVVHVDRAWIGQAGIWEEEWVRIEHLEARLAEIKRSPFFVDRADITIAVEGLDHQGLIDVISMAKSVGFADVHYGTRENVIAYYRS